MGDFAYHQEVLRKARVIERKREAARATDIQFGEEFTNSVGTKSGKREQVAARYNDYRGTRITAGDLCYVPSGELSVIKHRHVDNNPPDRVYLLMHPEEQNFRKDTSELPPRRPHFKV
ncbi:uncharacterized protein LOC106180080 isoform X3 [Lingula anatina]|uniref:Uncharacterized protein LOC106180080 isoform X3 n=1 Tax=Lingula anatina TaxID=7574 RepID=A0A1S3K9V5_LINAN|nr:uncharacterized protein LOC106180080 isoform X3 [Lingula anatina]|eukprot:XP_013419413.1 uncharacterized protein LOC106180080 isoform X3 [Lingula anatina]